MNRLQECFDHSYRRLVAQLYGICGDFDEAEDVVSEAFVKAAAAPRTFAAVDNPEAWLRTVAVNAARSRHRRRVVAQTWLRRQYEPPAEARRDAESWDLVQAMRRLPATQREVLALHYLADLPMQEVALTLGVTTSVVKARAARGRAALLALLGRDEADATDGDALPVTPVPRPTRRPERRA